MTYLEQLTKAKNESKKNFDVIMTSFARHVKTCEKCKDSHLCDYAWQIIDDIADRGHAAKYYHTRYEREVSGGSLDGIDYKSVESTCLYCEKFCAWCGDCLEHDQHDNCQ